MISRQSVLLIANRRLRHTVLVLLTLLWLPFIASAEQAQTLTLTLGSRQQLIDAHDLNVIQDLKQAARSVNIELELVALTAGESLHKAATGQLDGDFFRHTIIETDFPSLLRVNVALDHFDYRVWVHQDAPCITSFKELSQIKPVGVKGAKYFRTLVYPLSEVGYEEVGNFPQAFELIKEGRADYTVQDSSVVSYLGERTGITLKSCLSKPLFSLPLYLYLHESKRDLIKPLEQALEQAWKDKNPVLVIGSRELIIPKISTESAALLKQAGKQIGVDIRFNTLPRRRSLHLAAKGVIDGEFLRHRVIETSYPELLRVDAPLSYYDYWVWVHGDASCIPNRQSLSLYKPVGISGAQFQHEYVYPLSVVGYEEVNTLPRVVKMLELGRADYWVQGYPVVEQTIAKAGVPLKRCLDEPLFSLPFYLYLHESQRQWVIPLEQAIQEISSKTDQS